MAKKKKPKADRTEQQRLETAFLKVLRLLKKMMLRDTGDIDYEELKKGGYSEGFLNSLRRA